VEDLLACEARVDQVMAANPEAAAISLCLYDVERFDAELIVGVLRIESGHLALSPGGGRYL
jgi:hypothetical protein